MPHVGAVRLLGEWVDFHWEVDGETYDFSIPGGGFVSFTDLVQALGIADDAKKFTADVADVQFSNPELVWVGKIEENTTVGAIKDGFNLACEYSAELTEEQIAEINEQTVEAGDWALIARKAFDSEESLTVTMKTGEVFVIKVTDAQSDAVVVGGKVQTISNPAGTTIDLFDYWIDDKLKDSEGQDAWPDFKTNNYNNTGLKGSGNNKGINSSADDTTHGHALKFSPANSGTVVDGTLNNWNKPTVDGNVGINSWTKGASPRDGLVEGTLINGYPKLSGNYGGTTESLSYLFDDSEHAGKEKYQGVNQLLYVDPDGFYTYDSNDFKADFDKTSRTFSLTAQTDPVGDLRGFWPFGQRGYWAGMHMKTQFSMPVDGRVLSPKGNYNDMQFEFQGDDDTWLYVDDVLIGDGGGIHNQTLIRINFRDGTVLVSGEYDAKEAYRTNYHKELYLDDLYKAAGKYDQYDWVDSPTVDGHKTFAPGSYHTFDMFYLERGGGESNLKIKYNLIFTADFTAHKSYHAKDGSRLLRNDFKFELIGLDGQYKNGELIDSSKTAIMPQGGSAGGSGDVGDPKKVHADGKTSYIVGVSEDGNVNFGRADFSSQEMHDCDEGNPSTYRYIIREFVPDDAVNADGKTWAAATDEEKAEGGFKKGDITYDGKIYYMAATVTRWKVSAVDGSEYWEYGLSKKYYTDDTFTTQDTETKFVSFVNGYVEPLTLKVNKKGVWSKDSEQQEKDLPGAEFKLTRAKLDDGKWVERPGSESRTAISGSDGTLSFDNLTEGHYLLEETSAPDGYQKPDNKWLITITKRDADSKIELVPTITLLDKDGVETEDQETLTVSNNTFEKRVDNLRNPKGDITVTKKWLKYNGKEYTQEELVALGVGDTTITGELRRSASGTTTVSVDNPTVTIYGRRSTASGNGDVLWTGDVESGSDLRFSIGIGKTSWPALTTNNGDTITSDGQQNVTYDITNLYKDNANIFKLSNITRDTEIYAVIDNSNFTDYSWWGTTIYEQIGIKIVNRTEPTSASGTTTSEVKIDEPAFGEKGEFTLSSPNWSITWDRDSLNEDENLDYEYYLKNVTEHSSGSDFTFTKDEVGTVDPVTGNITFTQKNTHAKETIDVTVKKEWDPTPDSGSVTLKLRRYAKLTKGTINLTLESDKGGVIQGAKFELYKDNVATGTKYTTDENGTISVTGLDAGTYYLKQTSTPDNYSMVGCKTETDPWEVKGDLTTAQTENVTLTNKLLVTAGTFTIKLTDESGEPLEGGVFELYKEGQTSPITTLTTGADGTRAKDGLEAGTYYFVQIESPSGYVLPANTQSETFTVQDKPGQEQEKTVSMINAQKAKGSVEITLQKSTDHSAIAGAVFELYKGSFKFREASTGADGKVSFEDLPAGSYTVKQKSSISGFDITQDTYPFEVLENGNANQTFSHTFSNTEVSGNVTIKVYKARKDDKNNQELVETFTNLKPNTTYQIKIGVPENNIKNGDYAGFCANFTPGQAPQGVETIENSEWTSSGNPRYYTVEFTPTQNDKTYNIAIVSMAGWGFYPASAELLSNGAQNNNNSAPQSVSQRKLFGKNPLRGLLGDNSNVVTPTVPNGYGNDPSFDEQTIVLSGGEWQQTINDLDKYDADGNLYYYYIVETDHTPADYSIAWYSDAVNGDSSTRTLTVKNTHVTTGSVRITKSFSGEGVTSLPEGFKITATWKEGNVDKSAELTTSSSGMTGDGSSASPYTWVIDNLQPGTVVTFTESGIQKNGYSLTVNGTAVAGDSASVTADAVVLGQTVDAALINVYTPTAEITILKKDETNTSKLLGGATFRLTKVDAIDSQNRVSTNAYDQTGTTSSEDATKGQLKFEGLTPGYYYLEETDSPAGYVKTESGWHFEVTKDGIVRTTGDSFDENGKFRYVDAKNITVTNEPGVELPSTGGPGTVPFTAAGALFITAAGILVIRRKRRGARIH